MQTLYGLGDDDIYEYALYLTASCVLVSQLKVADPPIRDSGDIDILKTAVSGSADVICTRDRDFFEPPAFDFCVASGIAVYTDAQLLRLLDSQPG